MPCDPVKLPGGGMGIICSRGGPVARCEVPGCQASGTQLCDWPVSKGKTCDFRMCPSHALRVAREIDYCPEHAAERQARAREAR